MMTSASGKLKGSGFKARYASAFVQLAFDDLGGSPSPLRHDYFIYDCLVVCVSTVRMDSNSCR